MRGKDLLECIEQIDDALVEEAMEPVTFPHRRIYRFRGGTAAKWSMAAACVVVLGVSAAAIWSHQNVKDGRLGRTGEGTAGYPMAMNTAADDSDTGTGGSLDSSLAAAEDKKEAADDGSSAYARAAGSGGDTVCDGAAADGEDNTAHEKGTIREGSVAYDEKDMVHDGAVADSEDTAAGGRRIDELRKGSALDNSEDISSQSSAADEMSDKESTEVQNMEKAAAESEKLQYTIISDYYGEIDDSVYDYPLPEKGKIICYHYLNETIKHYAELESMTDDADPPIYAYNVVIDVYGDIEMEGSQDVRYEQLNWEDAAARNEMIDQEYRRLTDLGYAVQLAEDFRLTGTFTRVEIDTFQASPEYGYVFRFADE